MVHAHTTQGPRAHARQMGFRVCPRHAGGHTPDSHPQALSIFHYFALLVLLWVFGKTGGSSTTRPRPKDKQAHNATQSGKPKLPRGFTQVFPRGGAPIILSERPRTLPGNRISIDHCGNPGRIYRPEAARPPASSPSPPAIAPSIARACLVDGSASRQRRWVGEPPIHRPHVNHCPISDFPSPNFRFSKCIDPENFNFEHFIIHDNFMHKFTDKDFSMLKG